MPPFEDIGFMLLDIARRCGVDAARIVPADADAAAVDLGTPDRSGYFVVGAVPLFASDGARASLLLLNVTPRVLSERERAVLRGMAHEAQVQLRLAHPSASFPSA